MAEVIDYSSVEELFIQIAEHPSFVLRERVYYGGGKFGEGLAQIHLQFKDCLALMNAISEEKLHTGNGDLYEVKDSLENTLASILYIPDPSAESDEVVKLLDVLDLEMDQFIKTLIALKGVDLNKIETEEEKALQARTDALAKIEDNYKQIPLSFAWKMEEANNGQSIQGKQLFTSYRVNLEELIVDVKDLSNIQVLETLGLISMQIRDKTAQSMSNLQYLLPMSSSIVRIFKILHESPSEIENFRKDLEQLLNTKRLDWLASYHHFKLEQTYQDISQKRLEEFQQALNLILHDPKEMFLQTMIMVARANHNENLITVSSNFAKLASIAMGLVSTLEELQLREIAEDIQNADSVNIFDTIDDLEQLYQPTKINDTYLTSALTNQLNKLIDTVKSTLQFDEVRDTMFTIVQFTDIDHSLLDPSGLEHYLEAMRPSLFL